MEILVKIKEVHAMNESTYDNKATNTKDVFRSIGVTLDTGSDDLYVEAVQDRAEQLAQQAATEDLKSGFFAVQLSARVREYQDKNGMTRRSTDIRLNNWRRL